jgi:hypothetical protein
MSTENTDDLEVLDIGDDDGSTADTIGGTGDIEKEDRGDDFIDPDANDDGGDTADENPAGKDGPGETESGGKKDDEGDEGDGKQGDPESPGGNIPHSRLGEVARAKSAAVAIGKGLVDGSVDRDLIDELGGYDAVVKAVANKELSIDDLQPIGHQPGQQAPATKKQPALQPDDPANPANWDMDAKYIEYQELVDAGETKEAASLLRQINKEERVRERNQESAIATQAATMAYVEQLITDYPVLANEKSPEHESVMVWADHFQKAKGMDRIAALKEAVAKVGLAAPAGAAAAEGETAQQRTIRLRKEASMKKGAAASIQQPPPMGLGATPAGAAPPKDIAKMSEAEFAALSEAEKKKARGDEL